LCISCLWLAGKYEELYPKQLKHLDEHNLFDIELLKGLEKVIINMLEFNMTVPTMLTFLKRYTKVIGSDINTKI